ncbi:hypothetical protein BC831DRAFT_460948 [Entophlyctis helioformis]|nr:hypothetical protein BC831DRAFT_460948 [Entophlyctis helioformis]
MSLFTKKMGQFKQWTGEVMGNTQRTETSDEFKRLQQDTESRRECVERMHASLDVWHKNMIKRSGSSQDDRIQRTPLQFVANSLILYGSLLPDDSIYGRALVKAGQTHDKIANEEYTFSNELRDGLFASLSLVLDNVKEFRNLQKKLENRRLDFDAKLNKVHKVKKEKPELEEETRVCQTKYEETLTAVTEKMIEINTDTDNDLQDLLAMIDAELIYHERATQHLQELKESLADIPRHAREPYQANAATTRARANSSLSSRSNSETNIDMAERRGTMLGAGVMAMPMPGGANLRPDSVATTVSAAQSNAPPARPVRTSKQPMKRVKVVFDFDAEGPGELTIRVGEIVIVKAEIDDGWWEGEIADGSGRTGMFPSNYCEVLAGPPVPTRASRAPSMTSSDRAGIEAAGASMYQQAAAANGVSISNGTAAAAAGFTSRMAQSQSLNSLNNSSSSSAYGSNSGNSAGFGAASTASLGIARMAASQPSSRTATPPRSNSGTGLNHMLPSIPSSGASAAGPCSVCGCNEYVAHAFKVGQCNNCYHKH